MTAADDTIHKIRVSLISESGINAKIYQPVSEDRLIKLANDIKRNGLIEPLLLTLDHVLISGHTRLRALKHLNRVFVEVRYHNIYSTDPDFERLLVSCNDQRHKTDRERNNELKVQVDPLKYRREACLKGNTLDPGLEPVSGSLKADRHVTANYRALAVSIIKTLEKNREYLPITLRSLHYQLLNDPPITSKRSGRVYGNDLDSYRLLSRIATSLRTEGFVHYSAIADPTRRLDSNRGFENVDFYKKEQLNQLYSTYTRDLLRSQPYYFALIVEKETLSHLVDRVARGYGMPVLYCKGSSSITLRYRLVEDWKRNGEKPMVLFFLTDLDPAGLRIQNTFVGSLEADFRRFPEAFRVCITPEQITKHGLTSDMNAKTSDPNFKQFVKVTGMTQAYELEALPPDVLIREVDEVIRGAIDIDLYNEEIELYNQEIEVLERDKARILDLL